MEKSTFLEGYVPNFETLKRAAQSGDLALIQCKDRTTGKDVAVIAAVNFDGDEYEFVPLAMMPENPYEQFISPTESMDIDEKRE